jgi:hypothetical protein
MEVELPKRVQKKAAKTVASRGITEAALGSTKVEKNKV